VTGFFGDGEEIDYQNNQSVKLLEVPPGLTSPDFDGSLALPRSAYGNNSQVTTVNISPPSFDLYETVSANSLKSYDGVASSNYVSGSPSSLSFRLGNFRVFEIY